MCENLIGSYAFEKNENFDEFLSQMGVPLIPRKVMCTVKPGVTISKDGDRWTVTFKILIKNFNITFELGKEFEEDNPVSGEKNKCIADDFNGNLRIKTTHEKSGTSSTRIFCPTDEGFTVCLKSEEKNVEAKRYFKKTA